MRFSVATLALSAVAAVSATSNATDFTTSFVFGVAVATNKLLPPISINANHITSIERDNVNAQLLITGIYQDGSEAIITFPDNNGKTEILINFTTQGIPSVYSTAIDNVNAVFYFSYFDNTAQVYNLASFAIKNPAQITTNKLSCGNLLAANHFFYDSTLSKIAGIGFDITAKVFNYFEVVAGACTTKALGLTGVVTSATYDPTASTLYFGFVGTNTVLYSFNTKTYTLSKVTVAAVLSDVQVSYKV